LTDIHRKAIINVVNRFGFKASDEQHERVSEMNIGIGQTVPSSMRRPINLNINASMQEIYETIDHLANGIQTLNDDTQRLSSESIRLQTSIESLTQDFGTLKLSIQEQSAFLDGIKPNQEILQQDVASLKQRVDDMQYVSYDGTSIWKITNFREKMSKFNAKKRCHLFQ
jgi:chromosome segregation ATPase